MKVKSSISNITSVLSGIGSEAMFINREYGLNLVLKYNTFIESAVQAGSIKEEINRQKLAHEVKFFCAEKNVQVGKFSQDFNSVPQGSIAMVPVMGAMMRDSYCTLADGFISGTRDLEQTIKNLDKNENVDGIVFYINSPGGEARGNESLSKVIKSTKTPTVGFFEGMASAAVYSFQGVNELYAAERSSYWGSIGTYITLIDDKEFFKSMGIDILEIYAPQSTEKNIEFREALEGNTAPIEKTLETLTDLFIKDVKNSRPALKDDGHVFKGKLYTASEALNIGAIDGIKSLDFAIQRASYLSRKKKREDKKKTRNELEISNQNNENIMSAEDQNKVGFFNKIFGSSKNVSEAEQEIDKVKEHAANLEQNIEDLTKEKETMSEQLTTQEEKIKELTEQIAELEATNKAQNENLAALEGTEFESVSELVEDYDKVKEHNKELGGLENAALPVDNQQHNAEKSVKKERSYQDIIDEMQAESKEK